MAEKGETVKFKNYTRKIKSPFTISAYFESILISENNGKQNSDDSYVNNHQNHVGWSYVFKSVCVNDKCSKPFKLYLGQDAAHKFIISMTKESKYFRRVIKKF